MGVLFTIAVVLVAWCVCALVVGVIIGRAIALKPRPDVVGPDSPRRPVEASVPARRRPSL